MLASQSRFHPTQLCLKLGAGKQGIVILGLRDFTPWGKWEGSGIHQATQRVKDSLGPEWYTQLNLSNQPKKYMRKVFALNKYKLWFLFIKVWLFTAPTCLWFSIDRNEVKREIKAGKKNCYKHGKIRIYERTDHI